MVMDSLRYWVNELHVDGFRFDLGTILAREPDGFDNQSGFLKACNQDPVLRTVKLIAEPWDCGPGRLSGRCISAGLGRVERSVSRREPRFLERARPVPARSHHGSAHPAMYSITSAGVPSHASTS